MLRLFHSIFASPTAKTAGLDEALVERAIERVVDGTDSRLRAVIGYRKKLRSAVERTVEHVIELVDGLPPAVEFSKRRYGADARVRTLFASPNRLQEVVSNSQAIRGYVSQSNRPMTGMIYAGFGVERNESKRLGSELVGDDLRGDVEQVVVDFRNHRFAAISDDETTTRWELKKRGFDTLIQTTLQRLISERKKNGCDLTDARSYGREGHRKPPTTRRYAAAQRVLHQRRPSRDRTPRCHPLG